MFTTIAFTVLIVLLFQMTACAALLIRRPKLVRRLARTFAVYSKELTPRRHTVRRRERNRGMETKPPADVAAGNWRDLQGPVAERIENEVISGLVNFGMKESAARKLVLEQQLLLKTDRKRTDAAGTFEELWRLSVAAYQTAQTPRK